MKRALRVIAGAALLGAAIWYADPRALWRALAGVNPWLFSAAVAVAIVSNLVSALRWSVIARLSGSLMSLFAFCLWRP